MNQPLPPADTGAQVPPGSPTPSDGRYAEPYRGNEARSAYPERARTYWPWVLLGLLGPFVLAAPVYPLAALFVHYVALPPIVVAWEALSGILLFLLTDVPGLVRTPRLDFSPADPSASVREALRVLSAAIAFVCSRWLVRRIEGGHFPPHSPAERGFTAGSRAAILLAVVAALVWLNVRVVGA